MMRPAELAAVLQRAAVRAKTELVVPTKVLMEHAAEKSRSYIGQEAAEWPALAPSTIASKAAAGYATPAPLLRTGELRDSIHAMAEPTGFGAHGEIGSNDPKAGWQEHGTSRIPPRPFLSRALLHSQEEAIKLYGEFAATLFR